jgi:hypothetical protein
MSLTERLATAKPSRSGLPCGIDGAMQKMSKTDRESLLDVLYGSGAIGRERISNIQIHTILQEEGYDVALSSVALHRRCECRCYIGKEARANAPQKASK